MADEPVRFSPGVEEMLTASALPERDWEADARAIEARLKDVAAGSTEARWLDPPFPEEAPAEARGEGAATDAVPVPDATASEAQAAPAATQPSKPAPPSAASAPKTAPGLAELARSVAAKGSRPQATDIAKESLSVAAAARSHTDALVERVRGSRAASPRAASQRIAPPPPPSQRSADSESAPRQAPRSAAPARAEQQRSSQALPWIAVGGLGVLVIVLLVGKVKEPAAPSAAQAPAAADTAPAAQASPPSAASAAVAAAREEPARAAAAEEAVAAAEPIARTHDLPPLGVHREPQSGAAPAAANAAPVAKSAPATPGASPAAGAHPTRPEPEAVVLEDTPARAKGGAATTNSALRPAAGSPAGGLPDRPTSGAVQAAIGSVMGGARSCVAGTTGATPAQVTFGSDGAVRSVSVSGAAAGTPAASCIESALKRARVAPFASPSFTLMVWVRP